MTHRLHYDADLPSTDDDEDLNWIPQLHNHPSTTTSTHTSIAAAVPPPCPSTRRASVESVASTASAPVPSGVYSSYTATGKPPVHPDQKAWDDHLAKSSLKDDSSTRRKFLKGSRRGVRRTSSNRSNSGKDSKPTKAPPKRTNSKSSSNDRNPRSARTSTNKKMQDDSEYVEETATGAAQFISKGSKGPQPDIEDAAPRGRMSGGERALRRAATAATKTRTAGNSGGASRKVKRSATMDNASGRDVPSRVSTGVPSRVSAAAAAAGVSAASVQARGMSPKREGSGRYPRSSSMGHGPAGPGASRYIRQGTAQAAGSLTGVKATSNLLDDDSDLSDPDEAYDKHSSLALSKSSNVSPASFGGRPTVSAASTSSLPRISLSQNTGGKATTTGGGSTGGGSVMADESSFLEWDDPMAPPSGLAQDFSLGTADMNRVGVMPLSATELTRVVSVNLMGHSGGGTQHVRGRDPEPSPQHQQQTTAQPGGLFSKWFGGRSVSPQNKLGSTALAGFGKKYQVDQSVNLMDMENATKSAKMPRQYSKRNLGGRKEKQKSLMNQMFEAGFADIGLGGDSNRGGGSNSFEQHHKRRRSFVHKKYEPTFCERMQACVCGLGALVVVAIVFGGLLVLSLVYDGSLSNGGNGFRPPTPTVTMAPFATPAPSTSPKETPAPTIAPTVAPVDSEVVASDGNATATDGESLFASSLSVVKSAFQGKDKTVAEDARDHLSLGARERWDDLVGFFARNHLTLKEEFDDPSSAPFRALDWIVEYDSNMEYISSDTGSQIIQTYALMVFYFATHPNAQARDAKRVEPSPDSDVYDPNNDWIHHSATPVCHWNGIHCGHLHNVISLNLTQHELQGTLPGELKALEHLIRLDLSHNQIEGTLPAEYGVLEHLTLIDLSDNLLEGEYPSSWVAGLDRLETLDLSENPGLVEPIPQL